MFQSEESLGANRWPLVRLGVGSETKVTVLSTAFLPLATHWLRPTVPCAGEHCQLCLFLPRRSLYYLAVSCASRVSILELGSGSASHFEQHCKLMYGGIRAGLVVQLSRRSQRAPVRSEVVDEVDSVSHVSLFELSRFVMALYKYPCPNPEESFDQYQRRLQVMARTRNEHLAKGFEKRVKDGVQTPLVS